MHGPVTPAQSEALRRIRRSAQHLLGRINSVLDFAKVESGQIQYKITAVAFDGALRDAEAMVLPQMTAKNLRYKNEGCDPGLLVMADAEKLKQIVVNLLANSVKFTDSGGEIRMTCGAELARP